MDAEIFPNIGERVAVTGHNFERQEGVVVDLQDWLDSESSGTSTIVLLDEGKRICCDSISGLRVERV